MSHFLTPEDASSEAASQRWASRVLKASRGERTLRVVAERLGISITLLGGYEEEENDEKNVHLAKVARLDDEQRAFICRALMGDGWIVAKIDASAEDKSASDLLQKAHTAVQSKLAGNDDRSLARACTEAATAFLAQGMRALRRADAPLAMVNGGRK